MMKSRFYDSWTPWLLAALAVMITFVVALLEAAGFSPGRHFPSAAIVGVAELAGRLLLGDDATSRAQRYIWGFPFAAAVNGLVGWLAGKMFVALRRYTSNNRADRR